MDMNNNRDSINRNMDEDEIQNNNLDPLSNEKSKNRKKIIYSF